MRSLTWNKLPFDFSNQRVQFTILSLLKRISKESLAGNGLFSTNNGVRKLRLTD